MKSNRTLTLLSPFLLIAALILVGVACSETEPERVTDSDDDSSAAPASQNDDVGSSDGNQELEDADGFKVGDTVRMGSLVMHLHGVRWDEGSEFFGPDDGERWLVTDVEIENEADDSASISSILMFDLVDEDNRSRSAAIFAETEGSLDGELGPGRKMRGDLAWVVNEGQTSWELIFEPSLFGFGQAIFEISSSDITN